MWRTHQTLSFGTTRCIGIVRTMSILAHLTCLRICVMRCFGIVKTIPTSSSSWSTDHMSDSGLYVFIVFWSDLVYIVDWLLQWSKDCSDTTVFGWPTLWMSNRTICSPLRLEPVRCYLYVKNWFGDGTLCSDDVLYSEEHCTEDCEWITSFLKSYATCLDV